MDFTTSKGCNVSLGEAEHLGEGVLMFLSVEHPDFVRSTEVFFDEDSLVKLENWLAFRRESKKSFTLDDVNPPMCSNHVEVQHRDRLPPWCNNCGWSHGKPAVKARKYGGS